MKDRENPPDLDEDDDATLDRIHDARGQRDGAVRPLISIPDDEVQAEWDAYRAGRRKAAPKTWVDALRERLRKAGGRVE